MIALEFESTRRLSGPGFNKFPTASDTGVMLGDAWRRSMTPSCAARRNETRSVSPLNVRSRPAVTEVAVDRKSTRLNSSHVEISYAVFCLKKKKNKTSMTHTQ